MFEKAAIFSAVVILICFTIAGLKYYQHLDKIGATQIVKQ
jgi:hypothetical protein